MRVGIVGGGQLARMMILSGYRFGLTFSVLDPSLDAVGAQVANHHFIGAYDDQAQLEKLVENSDVITFDFENVPAEALRFLETCRAVYPSSTALASAQDRLNEKQLFQRSGLLTAEYATVANLDELKDAVTKVGTPGILKTRRFGYDGKGQFSIDGNESLEDVWAAIDGQPAIYEKKVGFDCEVSLICARGRSGQQQFYPLVQNHHLDGILHISRVSCLEDNRQKTLQKKAQEQVAPLLEALNYVGVLTVEFFLVGDTLIANEMAPRVHNSGHWSIEGATCSQFENHLRAIMGWPLAQPIVSQPVAMLNCLSIMPELTPLLAIPQCYPHDYGKTARAKRKLGHITLLANNTAALEEKISAVEPALLAAR